MIEANDLVTNWDRICGRVERGESVVYFNPAHLADFTLAKGVSIWAPEGKWFFFSGWDWMDAPYKESVPHGECNNRE